MTWHVKEVRPCLPQEMDFIAFCTLQQQRFLFLVTQNKGIHSDHAGG